MNEIFTLDTTLADPIITPGISFRADTIIMQNPTRYSLAVRVGSKSRPRSTVDATFVCPYGSMLVLPVWASEFSILATNPSLASPPAGMPTIATITFTRDEKPPAFGVIPLGGVPPASAVLLATVASRIAGNYNDGYNLPSNIRTLILLFVGKNVSGLFAYGGFTGTNYLGILSKPITDYLHVSTAVHITFPVEPDIDPGISISYTATAGTDNGYVLLGIDQRLPLAMTQADGRLLVDTVPPGSTIQPVDVDTFGLGMPITGSAGVAAPGAGANILTTPALAVGTYKFHVVMSTTSTAALGQAFRMSRYNAAAVLQADYILMDTPGHIAFDVIFVTGTFGDFVRWVAVLAGAPASLWSVAYSYVKIG